MKSTTLTQRVCVFLSLLSMSVITLASAAPEMPASRVPAAIATDAIAVDTAALPDISKSLKKNSFPVSIWMMLLGDSASSASVPATPASLSPGGSVATVNPTYSWHASAGATSYLLWVGVGSSAWLAVTFSATELGCASGSGTCSVTPATALTSGVTYSWNVKAINSNGGSVVSASQSITPNPVAAGTALAPLAFDDQPFGALELIQTIDTATTLPDQQLPLGVSTVQTLLQQGARTLPPGPQARYFTYRVGAGKGLVAKQAYVLDIEYPDDQSRSMFIANRGADFIRGFSTGKAIGDARRAYSTGPLESLNYPQSQSWKHHRSLFFLHERFNAKVQRYANCADRSMLPAGGFDVTVFQTREINDPFSKGAAVGKIRLYKVTNSASLPAAINYPGNLPRRHTFWREEMADEAIGSSDPAKRGVTNVIDWYGFKMDLGKALGFNTVGKDLMEFGFNQGFDSGNPNWISNAQPPLFNIWADIVSAASSRNLYLLPYLEYGGSQGMNCMNGQTCDKTPGNYFSLGYQHRPKKLFDGIYGPGMDASDTVSFKHNYSGTWWTENLATDVTDPDTRTDLHHLIDTILGKYKGSANFAGLWFRTRQTKLPISFAPETIARYNAANPGNTRTLAQLQNNEAARQPYYTWWFAQRAALLENTRDYARTAMGDNKLQVLFTAYANEPIPYPMYSSTAANGPNLITDDQQAWSDYVNSSSINATTDPHGWYRWAWNSASVQEALTARMHKAGLQKVYPFVDWSRDGVRNMEEPYHSTPPADPANYYLKDGVAMTYEFGNGLYTVADADLLEEYSSKSGQSLIHHFPLNEDEGSSFRDGECNSNNMYITEDTEPFDGKVGYTSVAVERAGVFNTLAEARALANGNPVNLGYLESSSMSRGFPAYVKRFNQALLSLPALPAVKVSGKTSDSEVVLKRIDSNAGTYYAVINTAMLSKTAVLVDFGTGTTAVQDLLGGASYNAQKLQFDLYPGEVRTFRKP